MFTFKECPWLDPAVQKRTKILDGRRVKLRKLFKIKELTRFNMMVRYVLEIPVRVRDGTHMVATCAAVPPEET